MVGESQSSPGASEAEVRAILENAGRLVQDAELLFENWRHASALVLAVYAVEELGKASLVAWEKLAQTANQKKWHRRKQSVLGSLYGAYVAVASVSAVMQRVGVDDRLSNKPEFFHPFVDALRTHPETVGFADGLFEAVVEVAAEALATDTKAKLLGEAGLGSIEKLKHQALYVDLPLTDTGPANITREAAREWIEHARFFYDFKRGAGVGHYPVVLPDESFNRLFGQLKAVLSTKRMERTPSGFRYVDS